MVHPATENSNVSLCALPFVGGSQDAFLKLCLCRWKREQLAFSSSNFRLKFLLCCWSETSFESSNMYMNNLGIWKMVQDQQQEHSSLSAQSPGSSVAVVLEVEYFNVAKRKNYMKQSWNDDVLWMFAHLSGLVDFCCCSWCCCSFCSCSILQRKEHSG